MVIEAASEQPARAVGNEHGLLGVEQLRRLGHEMDAGEHDHRGIRPHRLARQRQAVADDVGDAMEDLRRLIVVREDDGVALALQGENCVDVRGEDRPFGQRDDAFHAL